MDFLIENYVVGPVGTNCYFLINKETKQAIVFDPGAAADALYGKLKEGGYELKSILLTHGHFDHADGVADLKTLANEDGLDVSVYAYEAEKETLENPRMNLSGAMNYKEAVYHADVFLKDEQVIEIAGFSIRVLFTPGHTPGGCCYYLADEGICFTGDSLFCSSIGRTDFPGGSMSDLVRSVKEKVLTLPEDTVCYPGHDTVTSVGDEKRYNPFLA